MERTEQFELKSGAKGSELLLMACVPASTLASHTEQVHQRFDLPECPLFGLQYEDSKGFLTFLQPDKKVVFSQSWKSSLTMSHRSAARM